MVRGNRKSAARGHSHLFVMTVTRTSFPYSPRLILWSANPVSLILRRKVPGAVVPPSREWSIVEGRAVDEMVRWG
jgi:hypothetical protein